MGLRFVDSNIFVYVMMDDPTYSARALQILTGFEEGKDEGWTSTLVLSQAFSHLKKRKKHQAIDKFYDFLEESPIRITETTRDDMVDARKDKEDQGLPWSLWDYLVIGAQMRRLKLSEIYSNDVDFDKLRMLRDSFEGKAKSAEAASRGRVSPLVHLRQALKYWCQDAGP